MYLYLIVMRYIRELKKAIGQVYTKKAGTNTTLPQYWIIDTSEEDTLGLLIPSQSTFKLSWFDRKMYVKGWKILERRIVKNQGRVGDVQFINLVIKKIV